MRRTWPAGHRTPGPGWPPRCQTGVLAPDQPPHRYREWAAARALRPFVRCTWSAGPSEPGGEPVLPDACMDVIWDGARLFVAGPDTGPAADDGVERARVGIRFRPGAGPLFFGIPASALRDARADLELLWPDAADLGDDLAHAPSAEAARAVLERAVAARVPSAACPDPLVARAVAAWRADPRGARGSWLCAEDAQGERQLRRRFVAAVGYGPKRLQRILRFQAFLGACAEPGTGLAELAVRCGYFDQAHLSRETAAMSGRTPTELRGARLPAAAGDAAADGALGHRAAGGRNVQDGP